jgi:hypothetical protein
MKHKLLTWALSLALSAAPGVAMANTIADAYDAAFVYPAEFDSYLLFGADDAFYVTVTDWSKLAAPALAADDSADSEARRRAKTYFKGALAILGMLQCE